MSSKPYTASAWRRSTPLLDHREFVLFLKKKNDVLPVEESVDAPQRGGDGLL